MVSDSQTKREKILEEIFNVLQKINENEPKRELLSEEDELERLNKIYEALRELNEK